MKNLKKYLPCTVLNIFIVLITIFLVLICLIKSYVLSGNAFFDALQNRDIYTKIYNSIDSYFQDEYNENGIPKEVYLDVINPIEIATIADDVTYHGVQYINNNGTSLDVTYNFDELENSITKFFEDYAQSINYQKDDIYYEKIQVVTENAINVIKSQCDVFHWETLKSNGILDKIAKMTSYINYIQIALIVILIILLVILIVLNGTEYIVDNIYWIGCSLSISSVIMLIPSLYLKYTDYFSSFAIKSETLFNTVTGFLYSIIDKYIFMLIVLLILGVIFFIASFILNLSKHH